MTTSHSKSLFDMPVFSSIVQILGQEINKDYHIEHKFDALICTGLSGTVIASAISYAFQIPLIVIRKPNDSIHAETLIEGYKEEYKTVAFIDDFICTGKTLIRILDLISEKLAMVQGYFYIGDEYQKDLNDFGNLALWKIRALYPDINFPTYCINCYEL